MRPEKKEFWEKKVETLKAQKQGLKEEMTVLKKEKRDLMGALNVRNRLFNEIPSGIALVQDGKVLEMNKQALDHLGYTADEVKGKGFLGFVHPRSRAHVNQVHRNRLSGKRAPDQYETHLMTKTGEALTCEVKIRKIRYNGRSAVLAHITAIEERKERERAVVLSEKEKVVQTMISGLASRMGRDTEGLCGLAQQMKDDLERARFDDYSVLDEIIGASSRITGVLQTLDQMNRSPEKAPFIRLDLRKTVRESMARIQSEWEKGGGAAGKINFKTYLRPVSPIEGNPAEIQSMIACLVTNAAEAMPGGGDLYVTLEENAGLAHIYIQDSGPGIHDAVKAMIFDPFFSTKEQGAGLGMSIARGVVKRHRGEIELSSQKEQGTVVHVKFPIASPRPAKTRESIRRAIRDAQILVIQGEGLLCGLITQLMTGKGHHIHTSATLQEGLNRMKKKKFDLIMAAFQSRPDKPEAIATRLTKHAGGCPVVLIMDHSEEVDGDKEIPGVDLVIKKPVDMNRAVDRISELLTRKA